MPVTPSEAAATLQRRYRERHLARVERAKLVHQRVKNVVRDLALSKARIWLIGSLADGSFGERSDIDIVIDTVDDAQANRLFDQLERELALPIDLLLWRELDTTFQARVLRDGERLDVT